MAFLSQKPHDSILNMAQIISILNLVLFMIFLYCDKIGGAMERNSFGNQKIINNHYIQQLKAN